MLDELGWSQNKAARKLGVKAPTVTGWRENGVPKYAERFVEQALRVKRLWEEMNE